MTAEETKHKTLVRVVYTTSIIIEMSCDKNIEQVAEKIKEGEFTVLGSEEDPTKDQLQEVVTKAIADEKYDAADWGDNSPPFFSLWIDGRPYMESPGEGRFDKD